MDDILKLKKYYEIIGTLKSLSVENDHIKIIISINHEIDLPKSKISYHKIKEIIGKRIGIFNNGVNYKIRQISENK
jgi:hypothetical protein